MRREKEERMHCGDMMGPSEEAGATDNGRERLMFLIFLMTAELTTHYLRTLIQLTGIINFLS